MYSAHGFRENSCGRIRVPLGVGAGVLGYLSTYLCICVFVYVCVYDILNLPEPNHQYTWQVL